jgi:hypothetical protein
VPVLHRENLNMRLKYWFSQLPLSAVTRFEQFSSEVSKDLASQHQLKIPCVRLKSTTYALWHSYHLQMGVHQSM